MNAARHAITARALLRSLGELIYVGGQPVQAIVEPRVKKYDEDGHVVGSFMLISVEEALADAWANPRLLAFTIQGEAYQYAHELDRNGLVQIELREGAP